MTTLSLNSELKFGKYKGSTVKEVMKDDPDYLAWCCDTIEWFELDTDADEALEIAVMSNDEAAYGWPDEDWHRKYN